MEFIGIILVIWGLAFAIVRATEAATAAIKTEYRTRVDAAKARFANRTSGVGTGTKIGSGLAALCIGLPLWLTRLCQGGAAGWREGRERAKKRYGRTEPATPEQNDTDTDTDPATQPAPAVPAQTPAAAQPTTTAEPNAAAGTHPVQGGNPMAVATATGGEVTSVEQALAELQAIRDEAAASLEDAQADAKRSAEDAKRIETFVASLSNLKFGAPIIAGAHAMLDTAAQAATAARMRANAADQRLGQVSNLVSLMQQHLTIQDVGASVGGVAERQAYANS